MKSGQEILVKMDATLDQLIHNASTLNSISSNKLCKHEIEALQKTQESLLANLIQIDRSLDKEEKKKIIIKNTKLSSSIKEKAQHYTKLNEKLMKHVAKSLAIPKKRKTSLK